MEQKVKNQWLASLVCFHSVTYFGPIITKLIEAWYRGWFNGYYFDATYFRSIFLMLPFYHILLAFLAYYYVYKLEKKYALKLVMLLVFLLTCLMAYRLYSSGDYDWIHENYHIEIMARQALWFYAAIVYFIASYRWYSLVNDAENTLISLAGCLLGSIILTLFSGWLPELAGSLIIAYFLLSDQVQTSLILQMKFILTKYLSKNKDS